MKTRHYTDCPATEPLAGVSKRVLIGPVEGAPNFVMRLFEVATGHQSPDHVHAWEHEIYVLAGRGMARDGQGRETTIDAGMALFVPGGEKHCLINNGDETLRFLCLVPTGAD